MRKAALGTLIALAALLGVGALGWIGLMWWDSRLPDNYNVMDHGKVDFGGGTEVSHAQHVGSVSVSSLRGPRDGEQDASFTLTARHATIELASGRSIDALTFDGRSPGPELRVRQGDLVEVTLVNEDIEQGVTIHWHGVDVPNAEDGVAGVTQDAVLPGQRYVYRFRAEQVGTFWYHSHQVSSKEVRRGLFGAFVIEPVSRAGSRSRPRARRAHLRRDPDAERERRTGASGRRPRSPLRLRLVNSDNTPRRFAIEGTPFRVVALDGTDLVGSTAIEDTAVEIAGGGRADLAFTMPRAPVWLTLTDTDVGLALNANGRVAPPRPSASNRSSTRRPTASRRPHRSTSPVASTAASS